MSDYIGPTDYSQLVEDDGDIYLVNGGLDDPLFYMCDIDDLLECQRETVQRRIVDEDY